MRVWVLKDFFKRLEYVDVDNGEKLKDKSLIKYDMTWFCDFHNKKYVSYLSIITYRL